VATKPMETEALGTSGLPAPHITGRQTARRREAWNGYLFIAPWLVGFLAFMAYPIFDSLYLSFTRWDVYSGPHWIGITNYVLLFHDPLFYQSLGVTLYYSALSIPLNLIGGLALSLLLNTKVRGIGVFRTIFYIPSVITGVAVAMLWLWIFNPDYGLINWILSLVGITGPRWTQDPHWTVPLYVIMGLWSVGGNAILLLGGLQNIPAPLYEAAQIDGAGRWQQFWRITFPLLTPTLFFLLLMGIIGSFQVFTTAYVINGAGGGGPANSGLFYMLYLYDQAFQQYNMGYASAMAWVGGLLLMVLALVVFRTQNRWVYYDADVTRKGAR
jgi:multiple sugar transport system permease protein